MIKYASVLLLSAVFTSTLLAEPARYVVTTRTAAKPARMRIVSNSAEAARLQVRTFENINAFGATLTEEEVAELRRSPDVESIEPVVPRHMLGVGTLPPIGAEASAYAKQVTPWGLDAISARSVWPVTRGSQSVNVAVLDTGIDRNHPDLKHAVAGEYSIYTRENSAVDDNRHGTHVAGTIAAADNAVGVVGIAPNVRIWAVKVLDAKGDGTDEGVAAGLDWVVTKKAEVGGSWIVNLSIGAARKSLVEEKAVQRAIDAGVVVIAGAGNRSLQGVDYPAGYKGVIAVGALDERGALAGFSSHGIGMFATAPGVDIPSTVPVDSAQVADLEIDADTFRAYPLNGSPRGTLQGDLVNCAYCRPEDFPADMAGKIALCKRGAGVFFRDKARNAKTAGAAAVVIFNDDDNIGDIADWTFIVPTCDENGQNCEIAPEWKDYAFPVTIGVSQATGEKLVPRATRRPTTVSFRTESYALLTGTSMACPHVVGTVALLLSIEPNVTINDLYVALIASSNDRGAIGWDMQFGYGAVDALAAAKWIKPSAFGLPDHAPYNPPKRRSTRK